MGLNLGFIGKKLQDIEGGISNFFGGVGHTIQGATQGVENEAQALPGQVNHFFQPQQQQPQQQQQPSPFSPLFQQGLNQVPGSNIVDTLGHTLIKNRQNISDFGGQALHGLGDTAATAVGGLTELGGRLADPIFPGDQTLQAQQLSQNLRQAASDSVKAPNTPAGNAGYIAGSALGMGAQFIPAARGASLANDAASFLTRGATAPKVVQQAATKGLESIGGGLGYTAVSGDTSPQNAAQNIALGVGLEGVAPAIRGVAKGVQGLARPKVNLRAPEVAPYNANGDQLPAVKPQAPQEASARPAVSFKAPPEATHPADVAPAINNIANPKGPDVVGNGVGHSFLDTLHTMNDEPTPGGNLLNGRRGQIGDLEYKLMQDQGHYESGNIALAKLAKESQKIPEADKQAVFHYRTQLEAGVTPDALTPQQQHVNDNIVQPMIDHLNEMNDGGDRNYIPRQVQDKNTKYQQYLEGDRKSPTESVTRKTTDNEKTRALQSLTDENGNRTTVSIATPKDAQGKALGGKRVTALAGDKPVDLGVLKTRSNEDLLKRELGPFQNKLKGLQKQHDALASVKTRGGVSDARVNALAKQAGELQYSKDFEDGLTRQQAKSLRDAKLKIQELNNVKTPGTTAPGRLDTLSNAMSQLDSTIEQIKANYNPDELKGRVFTGKDGKRYTIGDPTAAEVHRDTNVRYFEDPIMSSALAVANKTNAINAEHTATWIKSHPQYDQYFSPTDSRRPSTRKLGVKQDFQSPETRTLGDVYAHPDAAKILNNYLGNPRTTSLAGRIWQGANSPFVQVIISNPGIHGSNLLTQGFIQGGNAPLFRTSNPILNKIPSGPVAILKQAAAQKRMLSAAYRAKTVHEMLQNGMHLDTYGKDHATVLTKAVDAAHLPSGAQFSKYNARAMSAIDLNFRATAYDSDIRSGMSPRQAVSQINTFMGKQDSVGAVGSNIGLFYRWLRTEGRSIKFQALSPVKNIGSITNTAVAAAAITYGLSAAYQAITGNPNAKIRNAGEIGLIHDAYKVGKDVVGGDASAALGDVTNVATSHIMPGVNAAITAGNDIRQGKNLKTAALDASTKLFAPEQNINKIKQGRMSPAEAGLSEFGGLYTPHAPGSPAAPNVPFLNASGTTPDQSLTKAGAQDPTGYQQEQEHYRALDKEKAKLGDDPNTQNALVKFFTRSHDSQGNSIQLNPGDRVAQYHDLLSNDRLLNGVKATEQASGSHAPSWDLPKDKLAVFLDYQAQYTGDPERTRLMQKYDWLKDATQADQNFYNSLPKKGNPAPWQPTAQQQSDLQSYGYSMGDTKYPQFDSQTQSDMTAYNNITDPTVRGQFLSSHPNVTAAFGQIGRYTNANRIVEGALPTQDYPEETPHIKAILDGMPQGNDPASRKARALAIQNNPDVNQYMANISLYNTTKDLAGYYLKISPNQTEGQELNNGSAESQQVLKGITSLGQYDIGKNAAGQFSFMQGGGLPAGTVTSSQAAYNKSKVTRANKITASRAARGVKQVARKVSFSHVSLPTGGQSRGRAYPKPVSDVYVKQTRSSITSKGRPRVRLKKTAG